MQVSQLHIALQVENVHAERQVATCPEVDCMLKGAAQEQVN